MIEAEPGFPKSLAGIIAGKDKIAPCLSPIAAHRGLAAKFLLVVARVEMPEVACLHDFAEQGEPLLATWGAVEFVLLHAKYFFKEVQIPFKVAHVKGYVVKCRFHIHGFLSKSYAYCTTCINKRKSRFCCLRQRPNETHLDQRQQSRPNSRILLPPPNTQ